MRSAAGHTDVCMVAARYRPSALNAMSIPQTGLSPGMSSVVVGRMVIGSRRRTGSVDFDASKTTASWVLSGLKAPIMSSGSPSAGGSASWLRISSFVVAS